jgi:small subunit ribosomal protein S17
MERGRLSTVRGKVVSDRMAKTIIVKSERRVKHPRYGKYVRKYTTYYAHDEKDEACEGDVVDLAATRPLSKSKRWRLLKIVTPSSTRETSGGES